MHSRLAAARLGTASDIAIITDSMMLWPMLTGAPPIGAGYFAFTTKPSGAITSIACIVPSL